MAKTIDCKGIDKVMEHFDMFETPYFAVFNDRVLKFSCDKDNDEEAKQLLLQNLQALKQSGTAAVFTINFYDMLNDRKITDKTPCIGSYNFQITSPDMGMGTGNEGGNIALLTKLYDEKFEKYILQQKVEELERLQIEGPGDDDDDDSLGMVGKVFQFGERYPWAQPIITKVVDILADIIQPAKDKLFNKEPSHTMGNVQTPGAPPADHASTKKVLNEAIMKMNRYYCSDKLATLKKDYPDMDPKELESAAIAEGNAAFAEDMLLLANITDNPNKFNMLITMLRTM